VQVSVIRLDVCFVKRAMRTEI